MKRTNKMTRDDLKSGYVVQLRNGEVRMVIRAGNFTKILVSPDGSWSYLNSGWNDDLKATVYVHTSHHESGHQKTYSDIMAVYGLITGAQYYGGALNISTDCRPLLWQRNPTKKMTMKEICTALGYEVEIVSDKE